MTREDVTLSGERADRFNRLYNLLEERLGYSPSKAEAMGIIMSEFPVEDYRSDSE